MRVSVVLPTYNRAHTVGAAISSALTQQGADFEIVVVDDGSTDETSDVVQGFCDPRIVLIRQANAGVAAARNVGVARARGSAIAFLDSDDVWRPGKLAADVAFLHRHPDVPLVFSDAETHDGGTMVASFTRATPVFGRLLAGGVSPDGIVLPPRQMLLCLLQEVPILPSTLTMRRDLYLRTGGFDPRWRSFEDWEFFLRLTRTEPFGYLDRVTALLRISATSLHRVDALNGRSMMRSLLLRERDRLRDDPEASAAVRAGIIWLTCRIAWELEDRGDHRAARHWWLRGARETGSAMLAGRALLAGAPSWMTRWLRELLGDTPLPITLPWHAGTLARDSGAQPATDHASSLKVEEIRARHHPCDVCRT